MVKDNDNTDIFQNIVDHFSGLIESTSVQRFGILEFQTANAALDQAASEPIPKMLFDSFWHEGELCVLFADTGVGKSILAVQIGESIASGIPILGFAMEAHKQPVIYFDFELGKKQFQRRYSNDFTDNYHFSENFYRGERTHDEIPNGESYETYLNMCFENLIENTGAKILIVDNLTILCSGDTDKASNAKPLMEYLLRLKMKYGVSILALEHTRKRDESREILLNDLQGSAMKSRFFDSAFCIGKSATDPNIRYLKQLKTRAGESKYTLDNVAVCQIIKPNNFTGFEFLSYGSEYEYLRRRTEDDKQKFDLEVVNLSKQGFSLREIKEKLGGSHMTIKRILDKNKSVTSVTL
jgi:hypothetical protein